VTRRALLAASVAAFVAAVTIAVTGGFVGSVGGVRVSARSSLPPFILGATLLVAWIISARRGNGLLSDLAWLGRTVESNGRRAAVAVSVCAGAVALTFATYSPSGADASGYLSQAHMWSRFETRVLDPLATLPAWPLPPAASAPLGWRPALLRASPGSPARCGSSPLLQ
jgi:hypothetical protein